MHLWWMGKGSDGNLADPSWEEVALRLSGLRLGTGIVELEVEDTGGARSLQVRAQAGAYVLADGERNGDEWLFRIRPPVNADAAGGRPEATAMSHAPVYGAGSLGTARKAGGGAGVVSILGDRWDASHVGNSLEAVVAAFRALYVPGTGSRPDAAGVAVPGPEEIMRGDSGQG